MNFYFIIFFLLLSKIFVISNLYNILFIPFLGFLFLSSSSKVHNKKLSVLLFIVFSFVVFSFLLLSGEPLPFNVALLRSFSIATLYLALLGHLPFDESLFNNFKLPLILSIPGILFLFNPPSIYSAVGSGIDFKSNMGLFDSFALVGLFPTSFYLAQVVTALLIYKISPIFRSYDFKVFPFTNQIIDRLILIFILVLTNRKVFLILLILYPITSLVKTLIVIFKNLRINKETFNTLIFRLGFISIVFTVFAFGITNFTFTYLFEQIAERLYFYTLWAFTPGADTLAETGMMVIYKYGGDFLFLISWIVFLSSFIYSLFKFKLSKISDFLIAYTLILLFLFKEAATVFSPSPSSLMLLMVVSMLINSSRSSFKRI